MEVGELKLERGHGGKDVAFKGDARGELEPRRWQQRAGKEREV